MKLVRSVVVLLVLLALAAGTAFAVDGDTDLIRFSVAVLDFEVNDLTGTVTRPERLGRAMATQFEVPLVQSRRFVVLTRRDLDRVLDELALADTGLLNPSQAREFGRLANVEVIVTGTITVFANDAYSVSTIFIDVETGELSVAETIETSNPQGFSDVAIRVVDRALQQYPLRGVVLDVDGEDVYIDIGQVHGLTSRDRGGVINRPREVAGRRITERVGTFAVVQIFGDVALIAVTLAPGRRVAVGDLVSIQALPEAAQAAPQRPPVAPGPEDRAPDEAAPEPFVGHLVLETVPEDALVFVDDVEVAPPVALVDGRYRVSVRADGYLEERFEVEIRDGASVERRVTLTRRAPDVTFDVTPSDAVVRLDGDSVEGATMVVEPGVYQLTVEAAGFEPYRQRLIVVPGQDQRVSVVLAPRAARLRLVVDAPAFDVSVDGRDYGSVDEIELAPGTYAVTVEAPGKRPAAFDVTLSRGETRVVEVALVAVRTVVVHAAVGTTVLARGSGSVVDIGTIEATPMGVELPIDRYVFILTAPEDAPWRDARPVETIRLDLAEPDDDDRVELFAPGYLSVEVPAGSNVSVVDADGTVAYVGGSRAFIPLVPGRYRIGVDGDGDGDGDGEVHEVVLAAGSASTVALTEDAAEPPSVASDGSTAAARSGTLTVTVNVDDAQVELRGPIERELMVGRESATASLPSGLYLVVARAPGRVPIEDAIAIDEGAEARLDLRFPDQRVRAGVGVHRRADETSTLLVWHVGAVGVARAVRVEVVGPAGWNDGRTYVASVDADQDGATVVVPAPPVSGLYTIESFVTPGASTVNEVELVDVGTLAVPDRLRVDSPSGDSLRVRWGGVRGAAAYTVEVRDGAIVRREHVPARTLVTPTARFDRLGVSDGSTVSVCVAAWSWDRQAAADPPTSGALVSETCTSHTLRTIAPAGASMDATPDSDPAPPAPPPVPPPPPP